jgi:hypothetical protein
VWRHERAHGWVARQEVAAAGVLIHEQDARANLQRLLWLFVCSPEKKWRRRGGGSGQHAQYNSNRLSTLLAQALKCVRTPGQATVHRTWMLAAWLVLPLASSLRKDAVLTPPGRLLMKGEMSTPWWKSGV